MNEEYGTVTAPGTVRLERGLPGPIERVWSYLTEPDKQPLSGSVLVFAAAEEADQLRVEPLRQLHRDARVSGPSKLCPSHSA